MKMYFLKLPENKILLYLKKYKISFICLAGYMRIVSEKIINYYRKRIINIHPSLLPKFKGLDTFSRVLKSREIKTGCTVHFVNNKLDSGSTITQKIFYIKTMDSVEDLKKKNSKTWV